MKKTLMKTSIITLLFVGLFSAIFIGCDENEPLKIYEYPEPIIESFSPSAGLPGAVLVITGKDFGTYKDAVTVFFNELSTELEQILSVEDDMIKVRILDGAQTGKLTLKIWTHVKEIEGVFTVIPGAKIEKVIPEAGDVGDEITLSGENFGNDASLVSVIFGNDVVAEVVSVTDTEIKVIVPEGGKTGAITVAIGEQVFSSPSFAYPIKGLNFEFNVDGEAKGWKTTNNSTSEVSNGSFNTSFDMSVSGSKRGDFKLEGGTEIHVGKFPIVAIKLNKPSTCSFIFDTNKGTYKDGKNNWDGVLLGDVYYYDITNGFGSSFIPSLTEETIFTSFSFKVADVKSDEKGYSVDWIRSFESLEELQNYLVLPYGKIVYEFDESKPTDYWIGNKGATNVIEDGKLKVTFAETTGKSRADLKLVEKGAIFPASEPNAKWAYSVEYPIFAFKLSFVGTGKPFPEKGNIKLDRYDNKNNSYKKDFIEDNVIYYDVSTHINVTKELSSLTLKIADIESDEPGYEVDWIRTFKTVEELEAFVKR